MSKGLQNASKSGKSGSSESDYGSTDMTEVEVWSISDYIYLYLAHGYDEECVIAETALLCCSIKRYSN